MNANQKFQQKHFQFAQLDQIHQQLFTVLFGQNYYLSTNSNKENF